MTHSVISDIDQLYLVSSQPMSDDFISPSHETRYHDMGAMQLWWSGADSTEGTFLVQFSLDNEHWSDSILPGDAANLCAGSGSAYFEFPDITCNYWRVKFDANANTAGVVTILSNIKRRR